MVGVDDELAILPVRIYSDGPTDNFTYDTDLRLPTDQVSYYLGRLASSSRQDANGNLISTTAINRYDILGRPTTHTQTTALGNASQSFTMHYAYNLAGGLESETLPSGTQINTCYDTVDRPKTVNGRNASAKVDQYTPHGAVQQMTLGNGVVESTSFNVRLQPTAITIGAAASPLLALGYSYCSNVAAADCIDNNGNLQFQTIAIGPGSGTYRWQQRYAYDPFNRLTSATESKLAGAENLTSGWSQTYAFDPYGNRALVSAGSYTPGNNDTSALPTVLKAATPVGTIYNGNNQWIGATHDRHGNLTAMAGRYQLGYDLDDLMTTSTVSGVATSYQYDADGRRVTKQSGSKSTIFVYDASGQLAAESSQKEPTAPSLVTYLSNDHLGSTRLRTSKEGTVIGRYDYLPFGDELSQMDNLRPASQGYPDGFYPNNATTVESSRTEFTGKERDAETGLDYFGARYFSAGIGRWTSADEPMADQHRENPQTWNLYAYVRNSPLSLLDTEGRATIDTDRRWAVQKARNDEIAMVQRTGPGTRPWNRTELAMLRRGQFPPGYQGHHIFNVKNFPELARVPENIDFVREGAEHLARHDGFYGNRSIGKLNFRAFVALDLAGIALQAYQNARVNENEKDTGIHADITGLSVTNVDKAAQSLDPGAQIKSADGTVFTLGKDKVFRSKDGDTVTYDEKKKENKINGPVV